MNSSWLFAALSGLMLGLAFPPSAVGPLCLIAYVPFLYAIVTQSQNWSRGKALVLTYLMFFIYHASSNWWISSWQEQTDPFLFLSGILLALFHPFFLALPFWILIYIHKKLGSIVTLAISPFAIAGFEWLHGQTDASYPWLTTGYSLINTPLAQAADLIGVYGLTFLIVTTNTAITWYLLCNYNGKGSTSNSSGSNNKTSKKPLYALTVFMLVWVAYGVYREQSLNSGDKQTTQSTQTSKSSLSPTETRSPLKVALVQPNEDPWNKWADPREQVNKHLQLTNAAIRANPDVDLVVWSETAIPYVIMDRSFADDWRVIRDWVDSSHFSLLTGFAQRVVYAPQTAPPSARHSEADASVRFDTFNAALLAIPNQPHVQVHQKSMLTPFAERLPFADQLSFGMKWIEWGVGISAWGKGLTRIPLNGSSAHLKNASIGPIICIESIYPEVARDFVNNGATVLCVITNDAWYNGTSGPRQHYCIAQMRAIEQRRWLFRVGNSGVTGIIDARGKSVTEIQPEIPGVCVGVVEQSTEKTVYSYIGNLLPETSFYITCLIALFARFPLFIRKMQVRTNQ
ncbi:MAG: apolipoprotein N-acyltransferase [Ignavibacteria bacterium]|nr:apolipoprotein N-acyltransferase [Ignavibacteria bacterium]